MCIPIMMVIRIAIAHHGRLWAVDLVERPLAESISTYIGGPW